MTFYLRSQLHGLTQGTIPGRRLYCCSTIAHLLLLLSLQVILVRDLDSRARLPKELQHSNALIMTVAQSKG